MEGTAEKMPSLLNRTYSKEEILNRQKYIIIENSEIPANSIDIEKAVNTAIKRMKSQLNSLPKVT